MRIHFIDSSKLPTPFGTFTLHGFEEDNGQEHIVLTMGNIETDMPVLARVHSECLTGDSLFSMRCDCGFQLQEAMKAIAEAKQGMILYLRQEGRGIGLINKIRAYHLQDNGADTVEANNQLGYEADMRHYDMCQPMLEHFGVKRIRLMTNNPKKVDAMINAGVDVYERVPLLVGLNPHNQGYLTTKADKLDHMLEIEQGALVDVNYS